MSTYSSHLSPFNSITQVLLDQATLFATMHRTITTVLAFLGMFALAFAAGHDQLGQLPRPPLARLQFPPSLVR
jgi:hypothetical protein